MPLLLETLFSTIFIVETISLIPLPYPLPLDAPCKSSGSITLTREKLKTQCNSAIFFLEYKTNKSYQNCFLYIWINIDVIGFKKLTFGDVGFQMRLGFEGAHHGFRWQHPVKKSKTLVCVHEN